ncbi:glycerol-3-phosphate dehydrogenase/oxidase [Candidatus Laterigemmans baculatus]|uniref:glycerol-3-phosphate dehydrogenase/oxidase n=1 Tax=Candidatus Laterigemmans baculatus TaxID=2770505 RepID=UPI0013D96F63|nr:glycerol-3-phosphate dehydrogenase/oxidase [Candidatus Laterigemmans baculatus]
MTAPILILGAGINGAALARELLLNGVPVTVVDRADIASGATAYSSRLIHGGLRYLEYGELDLVRESLEERTRLLQLAPQFVKPLELFIPVSNRFGGVRQSAAKFLRFPQWGGAAKSRGLWLVRTGLWMYDTYARDPSLPKHRVYRNGDRRAISVDARHYPWLAAYHDAQIAAPERFTVALLEDARRIAAEQGIEFDVLTYHEARREGEVVQLTPLVPSPASGTAPRTIRPATIINATGAWVDRTLERLHVPSERLMGGTQGSHFFTRHPKLIERLAGRGLYGEAEDGRPVFVLPLAGGVLVGTTDLPYEGDPADAVASEEELQYLLRLVNQMFPEIALERSDIQWHYSGVRPLPYSGQGTPASVTRRHWVRKQQSDGLTIHSVIGGKLTTCRALAEEATAEILDELQIPVVRNSRERGIPGSENFPRDAAAQAKQMDALAEQLGWSLESVAAVWSLCGSQLRTIVGELQAAPSGGEVGESGETDSGDTIRGTSIPRVYARWVIEHEWAWRLDDLIERRLMLLYDPGLTEASLRELALLLVDAGRLEAAEVESEIARVRLRLAEHFGKRVAP